MPRELRRSSAVDEHRLHLIKDREAYAMTTTLRSAILLVTLTASFTLSSCGGSKEDTKGAEATASANASLAAEAAEQQKQQEEAEVLLSAQTACASKFASYQEVLNNARDAIDRAGATSDSLGFMLDDANEEAAQIDVSVETDSWCKDQVESNLRAAHQDIEKAKADLEACVNAGSCENLIYPDQPVKEFTDLGQRLDAAQSSFDNYGG